MGKKLTRNVVVDGTLYGPSAGDREVPADVLKRITNPKAFDETRDPTPAERIEAAEKELAEARAAAEAERDEDADSDDSGDGEADSDGGTGAGEKPARSTRSTVKKD